MRIWAIGDLHLSFGVKDKSMAFFGPEWDNHEERIATFWRENISAEDLVLIPGDISWALKVADAVPDLQWIHELPGTKVLIKGNHDYWWSSLSKLAPILPSSLHLIQNNAFLWNGVAIGGARMWDTPEYSFNEFVNFRVNPRAKIKDANSKPTVEQTAELFERELQRLELSLAQLDPTAKIRIAMTHYPPLGSDLKESRTSAILEKYKVDLCVFGHLHNIKPEVKLFDKEVRGVKYVLTSCDYMDFKPVMLLEI